MNNQTAREIAEELDRLGFISDTHLSQREPWRIIDEIAALILRRTVQVELTTGPRLTSDEREQRTPEQIFIIPTKQWGLIPTTTKPTKSDYVEYVRADVAATQMRDKCVGRLKARRDKFQQAADSSSLPNDLTASRDAAVAAALTGLLGELKSLTLDTDKAQ